MLHQLFISIEEIDFYQRECYCYVYGLNDGKYINLLSPFGIKRYTYMILNLNRLLNSNRL